MGGDNKLKRWQSAIVSVWWKKHGTMIPVVYCTTKKIKGRRVGLPVMPIGMSDQSYWRRDLQLRYGS